jgi:lipopolysaccharide/colanic/teichoic acid biosynthesis glycosyltransferase
MATVATLVFALAAASLHGAVTVDPLGLGFCWLFMAALLRVVLGAASEQGRQSGLEVQSRHRDAGGLPAGALPHASLPTLCAFFKRTIDLVAALAVLPLALPIIAVAAVAITLDSEGGWLFRQTRLGRGGRPFQLLKLRTMVAVNDDMEHRACMAAHIGGSAIPGPPYGKVAADRRVTRVGRVLRRFSIDELPQLWNVIKGEMSLVGPRPPLPWEVELYDDRAIQRLDGKPGLTGLWQVQGRGDVPFSEMVSLDLHYLETWSPMADLRILARTPKAALWARNTA